MRLLRTTATVALLVVLAGCGSGDEEADPTATAASGTVTPAPGDASPSSSAGMTPPSAESPGATLSPPEGGAVDAKFCAAMDEFSKSRNGADAQKSGAELKKLGLPPSTPDDVAPGYDALIAFIDSVDPDQPASEFGTGGLTEKQGQAMLGFLAYVGQSCAMAQ